MKKSLIVVVLLIANIIFMPFPTDSFYKPKRPLIVQMIAGNCAGACDCLGVRFVLNKVGGYSMFDIKAGTTSNCLGEVYVDDTLDNVTLLWMGGYDSCGGSLKMAECTGSVTLTSGMSGLVCDGLFRSEYSVGQGSSCNLKYVVENATCPNGREALKIIFTGWKAF
ncbi:MAG: hypothetical protein HQK79_12610 [Desulfobacterales bacterium]|nr:hypothetical protein [Desulfobacterales bacterium]